jgi:hypothetical protein
MRPGRPEIPSKIKNELVSKFLLTSRPISAQLATLDQEPAFIPTTIHPQKSKQFP